MPKRNGERDLQSKANVAEFLNSLTAVLRNPPEEFCIRHPSPEARVRDFPNKLYDLYVPWVDPGVQPVASHLRALQKEHRATGNGLCLLSAFVIAHECKLYPPMWVLKGLVQSFKSHISTKGLKSLDKLLGLQPSRGRASAYKAAALRARNRSLARDIWFLTNRFELSIDEAVDVVMARLGEKFQAVGIQSTQSMAKMFSTKWKKEFGLTKEHYKFMARNYSDTDWRDFLKRFPTDGLSQQVKVKLQV
jgi:hypothetical protein